MKNWKESRNYRRIKDEHGQVVANIITVDGVDVEVAEDVFLAYSQMDRRGRYQEERQADSEDVSLNLLEETNIPIDLYLKKHQPSTEETLMCIEALTEVAEQRKKLKEAMSALDAEEKELVRVLFFDGVSAREYARSLGVYPRAVMYRKEKLLEKLRKKILS